MTDRPVQFGNSGGGRALGFGQAPLVSRGSVPTGATIDTATIAASRANMMSKSKSSLMPVTEDFRLLAGEMAFKVRGSRSVLTTLNGLDVQFVEQFPNQPEVVAALLESIIQPIGVVEFDARTDTRGANPPVTLLVGGTVPQGSPCLFNRPGQEKSAVTFGGRVIFGVPNLSDPKQFGNPGSGRSSGKVGLVARGQDKRSFATRATLMIGTIVNDPTKFRKALKDYPLVANSWTNLSFRLLKSYKVAALMLIDLLLKRNILSVDPAALELLDSQGNELDSEETVTQIAKLLGVVEPVGAYATLTAAQRKKWKELAFEANGRMTLAPLGTSGYNAAHEFGFGYNAETGEWGSKARAGQTGEIQRTPTGDLLKLQITHMQMLLESCAECMFDENRLCMGIALTEPSNAATGRFDMLLQVHGGMSDIQ